MSYEKALELAQNPKLRIFLSHTDENGELLWALMAFIDDEDLDFWMDTKSTKKEAIALCRTMGWKITT